MKKIFLLIAPLLLASCSDDDSKTTAVAVNAFNPPSWIQGAWAPESSAEQHPYSFVFTKDNICYSAANTNTVCWKETLNDAPPADYDPFEEHVTDSTYTVSYTVGEIVTSISITKLDNKRITVFVPQNAQPAGSAGVFVKKS